MKWHGCLKSAELCTMATYSKITIYKKTEECFSA